MTSEHTVSFTLDEIKHVCFECNYCHAKLSVRPGELEVRVLEACPSCKRGWWPQDADTSKREHMQAKDTWSPIVLFGKSLQKMALRQHEAVAFTISLEFDAPKDGGASASASL